MGFLAKDKSEAEVWYLSVLWLVETALFIFFCIWYFLRRNDDLIASRNPIAALVATFLIWLDLYTGIIPNDIWAPRVSCDTEFGWVLLPVNEFALLTIFMTAAWRCLQLIAKFETQRIRLSIKLREEGFEREADAAGDNNFFQRHVHVITSWQLATVMTLYCTLWPVYRLIVRAPFEYEDCTSNDLYVQVFAVPIVILLAALATKVRTVRDGFFIGPELRVQGAVAVFHVVFIVIFPGIYPAGIGSALWHIETIGVMVVIGWVTLCKPLWYSYYPQKHVRRHASNPKRTSVGAAAGGEIVSAAVAARQSVLFKRHNKVPAATGAARDDLVGTTTSERVSANPNLSTALTVNTNGDASGTGTGSGSSHAAGETGAGTGFTVYGVTDVPLEVSTLELLLQSKPGRQAFTMHLMLEFSLESLMFYDEVNRLKGMKLKSSPPLPHAGSGTTLVTTTGTTTTGTLAIEQKPAVPPAPRSPPRVLFGLAPDPVPLSTPLPAAATVVAVASAPRELPPLEYTLHDIRRTAREIYDRFIAPSAPLELNLSSEVKRTLRREFRSERAIASGPKSTTLSIPKPGASAPPAAISRGGSASGRWKPASRPFANGIGFGDEQPVIATRASPTNQPLLAPASGSVSPAAATPNDVSLAASPTATSPLLPALALSPEAPTRGGSPPKGGRRSSPPRTHSSTNSPKRGRPLTVNAPISSGSPPNKSKSSPVQHTPTLPSATQPVIVLDSSAPIPPVNGAAAGAAAAVIELNRQRPKIVPPPPSPAPPSTASTMPVPPSPPVLPTPSDAGTIPDHSSLQQSTPNRRSLSTDSSAFTTPRALVALPPPPPAAVKPQPLRPATPPIGTTIVITSAANGETKVNAEVESTRPTSADGENDTVAPLGGHLFNRSPSNSLNHHAPAPRRPRAPTTGVTVNPAPAKSSNRGSSHRRAGSGKNDGNGANRSFSHSRSSSNSGTLVSPPRSVEFYRSVFDAAHAEILHLLDRDSYRRFVHSALFDTLIDSLNLAQHLIPTPKNGAAAGDEKNRTPPATTPKSPQSQRQQLQSGNKRSSGSGKKASVYSYPAASAGGAAPAPASVSLPSPPPPPSGFGASAPVVVVTINQPAE